MVERLRRLWWLELVIVLIAVTAISRLGVSERAPASSQANGQPLVLRFQISDRMAGPVGGARVRIWHPDARPGDEPRGFEGTAVTSEDGEATLYSVMPGHRDRRILYSVEAPRHEPLSAALALPDRPGRRSFQAPHVLTITEDRNRVIWRADVQVELP